VTRLAYFEWSADEDAEHDDPEAWAQANPALGIRIGPDFIRTEMGALEAEDFARERLGIFPEDIDATEPVIDDADWRACAAPASQATGPLVLAFEVGLDRKWAQIGVAAASTLGGVHVEIIENRRFTTWVVARLLELQQAHTPTAIVCNPAGPAGGLIPQAEKAGLVIGLPDPETGKIKGLSGRDYTQACQAAYDAITEHHWRHIDQPELSVAVGGATKRTVGDAFVFDRRGAVDISPLLTVTMAAWAHGRQQAKDEKVVSLW
jgi:hypothetical protein